STSVTAGPGGRSRAAPPADSQRLAPPFLVGRNISIFCLGVSWIACRLLVLADGGPQAVAVQHLDIVLHGLASADGDHRLSLMVDVKHQLFGFRTRVTED